MKRNLRKVYLWFFSLCNLKAFVAHEAADSAKLTAAEYIRYLLLFYLWMIWIGREITYLTVRNWNLKHSTKTSNLQRQATYTSYKLLLLLLLFKWPTFDIQHIVLHFSSSFMYSYVSYHFWLHKNKLNITKVWNVLLIN